MKQVRFDSVGGASGDMILAALVDLGADVNLLQEQLQSLPIENFRIESEACDLHGTRGRRLRVDIPAEPHHHRTLADIRAIIEGSQLPAPVKTLSIQAFERLAEAEAEAHHTSADQVHFHEVGAVDSIVDTVGGCLALHLLEIDQVAVGPLPLGSGTVQTAHGLLPIPVPATLALLTGHPTVRTDEPYELVTPTGATLLTTWAQTRPAAAGPVRPIRTGHGFGQRTLAGRLNLLRATLLETDPAMAETGVCHKLECNVDDTAPELIGSLVDKLWTLGALEVFTTGVQMKKQRPGVLLTVLCRPQDKPPLVDAIFAESATLGVREQDVSRTMLPRRIEPVETPYGTVGIKIGAWKGRDITWSPEHADCVRCAETGNVPVRAVYESARRAADARRDAPNAT